VEFRYSHLVGIHITPFPYNEFSDFEDTLVWTGTFTTGTAGPFPLGSSIGLALEGQSSASPFPDAWAQFGEAPTGLPLSLYGYSDIVTVAAPVPEPNGSMFLLTVIAVLGFGRRRKPFAFVGKCYCKHTKS